MKCAHSKFYLAILFGFISSCTSVRVNPLLSQDPDTSLTKEAFLSQSLNSTHLWEDRLNPASILQMIHAEEKRLRSTFATHDEMVRLSRAHFFYADYHTQDWAEKTKHWEQGANWAEKALMTNPAFKTKVMTNHVPPEFALEVLTAKDADALYWFAENLGWWTERQGISIVLKYRNQVKKMMDRVAELSPQYLQGGVYRFYGIYYATSPGYTAEDLKRSKKNFEVAITKYPDFFSNHVQYAEHYAEKLDQQRLLSRQLKWVIQGNAKKLKDFYPEQVLEQRRASQMLRKNEK